MYERHLDPINILMHYTYMVTGIIHIFLLKHTFEISVVKITVSIMSRNLDINQKVDSQNKLFSKY